jgi:hypothetical protein
VRLHWDDGLQKFLLAYKHYVFLHYIEIRLVSVWRIMRRDVHGFVIVGYLLLLQPAKGSGLLEQLVECGALGIVFQVGRIQI